MHEAVASGDGAVEQPPMGRWGQRLSGLRSVQEFQAVMHPCESLPAALNMGGTFVGTVSFVVTAGDVNGREIGLTTQLEHRRVLPQRLGSSPDDSGDLKREPVGLFPGGDLCEIHVG